MKRQGKEEDERARPEKMWEERLGAEGRAVRRVEGSTLKRRGRRGRTEGE